MKQNAKGYTFHPVADAFPLMEGEAFRDFVDDIRRNGVHEPIWTYQGQIIDGRNRYRACLEVGVKPQFREWTGTGSLVAFVVSLNCMRRHLDASQRATVAARLETLKNGQKRSARPIGLARPEAAALMNVSVRAVTRAAQVIKHGIPELVAAVDRGDVAVSAAAKVARLPKDQQRIVVAERPKAIRQRADSANEQSARTPTYGDKYVPDEMELMSAGEARLRSNAMRANEECLAGLKHTLPMFAQYINGLSARITERLEEMNG